MIFLCGILLLYGYFLCPTVNGQNSSEYEDINDFFASSFQQNNTLPDIPDVFYKNITIDIENIDPQRIRRKFEMLQPEINKKEEILRQSRRQVLTFKGLDGEKMKHASEYMTRTKLADLMLQIIYMARHKLKELEDDPNYVVNDPGFRVGYLYQKMRKILRKLRQIKDALHTHNNKSHGRGNDNRGLYQNDKLGYETMGPGIVMHTKAVRLYIDFIYIWKVMINIDDYKMKEAGIQHRLAKGDTTGGLTDDESSIEVQNSKESSKVYVGKSFKLPHN